MLALKLQAIISTLKMTLKMNEWRLLLKSANGISSHKIFEYKLAQMEIFHIIFGVSFPICIRLSAFVLATVVHLHLSSSLFF